MSIVISRVREINIKMKNLDSNNIKIDEKIIQKYYGLIDWLCDTKYCKTVLPYYQQSK